MIPGNVLGTRISSWNNSFAIPIPAAEAKKPSSPRSTNSPEAEGLTESPEKRSSVSVRQCLLSSHPGLILTNLLRIQGCGILHVAIQRLAKLRLIVGVYAGIQPRTGDRHICQCVVN